jgi:NAD(P)-dependent dehydrogenase (short-subunit alcohol dehydrogenase family)
MSTIAIGKVVLITGAAQGIGRVVAAGFARSGWDVAVADIQFDKVAAVAEEISGPGRNCAVRMDVGEDASVATAIGEVEQRLGRIDALINNAALFTQLQRRPLTDVPLAEWHRVMEVNLAGPFLTTRHVVQPMRRAGGGSIINISTVGIYHGTNQLAHYNASKAGLIGLTRTAAAELGKFNIRVNAVAPGSTATEAVVAVSSRERLAEKARNRCIARVQTPEDLIGPLLFLASDQSAFVTGQLLNVDGGEFFH